MIIISNNKNKGDIVIGKSTKKPVFDISNFKLEVNTTVWSYLHGKGIVIEAFKNTALSISVSKSSFENSSFPLVQAHS